MSDIYSFSQVMAFQEELEFYARQLSYLYNYRIKLVGRVKHRADIAIACRYYSSGYTVIMTSDRYNRELAKLRQVDADIMYYNRHIASIRAHMNAYLKLNTSPFDIHDI